LTGARGPAATGLGKQLRAAQARVVVPFEDNRHLNRLLGEFDGHLALLEERLGIEAQAHGNVVTLTGPTAACETAREVLEKLYARIRQGEDIGPGDVDGLLRHAGDTDGPADGLAQIRTRRRVVTARSPMQSAYVL
jgi:phosphate starvation-inducible PhoH-like protein